MNNMQSEQRQLELATARQLPPGSELSSATKELREGWLALAGALEQLPDRAPAAFAARLANQLNSAPATVHPRRRPWMLAAAAIFGAIAAALLLALTIWPASQPGRAKQIAEGEATKDQPAANIKPTQVSGERAVAWDDPLDDQIAQMQEDVAGLGRAGHGLDASLSAFDQKLAELADDLDGGSL